MTQCRRAFERCRPIGIDAWRRTISSFQRAVAAIAMMASKPHRGEEFHEVRRGLIASALRDNITSHETRAPAAADDFVSADESLAAMAGSMTTGAYSPSIHRDYENVSPECRHLRY